MCGARFYHLTCTLLGGIKPLSVLSTYGLCRFAPTINNASVENFIYRVVPSTYICRIAPCRNSRNMSASTSYVHFAHRGEIATIVENHCHLCRHIYAHVHQCTQPTSGGRAEQKSRLTKEPRDRVLKSYHKTKDGTRQLSNATAKRSAFFQDVHSTTE